MKYCLKLFLLLLISSAVSAQQKTPLTKDQISDLKSEGSEFFNNENYREALKRYQQIANAEPDNVDFNYKAGVCLLKTYVDKKKAVEYLKNVLNKKDSLSLPCILQLKASYALLKALKESHFNVLENFINVTPLRLWWIVTTQF